MYKVSVARCFCISKENIKLYLYQQAEISEVGSRTHGIRCICSCLQHFQETGLGHFGRGHLGRGHYGRGHLGRGHCGRGHFGRGHFGPLI